MQLCGQKFSTAFLGDELSIGAGKELTRLQKIGHKIMPDRYGLSSSPSHHEHLPAVTKGAQLPNGSCEINLPHDIERHLCFRGEDARSPDRLMIEEVANLVDNGHLGVLAEAAETEA